MKYSELMIIEHFQLLMQKLLHRIALTLDMLHDESIQLRLWNTAKQAYS